MNWIRVAGRSWWLALWLLIPPGASGQGVASRISVEVDDVGGVVRLGSFLLGFDTRSVGDAGPALRAAGSYEDVANVARVFGFTSAYGSLTDFSSGVVGAYGWDSEDGFGSVRRGMEGEPDVLSVRSFDVFEGTAVYVQFVPTDSLLPLVGRSFPNSVHVADGTAGARYALLSPGEPGTSAGVLSLYETAASFEALLGWGIDSPDAPIEGYSVLNSGDGSLRAAIRYQGAPEGMEHVALITIPPVGSPSAHQFTAPPVHFSSFDGIVPFAGAGGSAISHTPALPSGSFGPAEGSLVTLFGSDGGIDRVFEIDGFTNLPSGDWAFSKFGFYSTQPAPVPGSDRVVLSLFGEAPEVTDAIVAVFDTSTGEADAFWVRKPGETTRIIDARARDGDRVDLLFRSSNTIVELEMPLGQPPMVVFQASQPGVTPFDPVRFPPGPADGRTVIFSNLNPATGKGEGIVFDAGAIGAGQAGAIGLDLDPGVTLEPVSLTITDVTDRVTGSPSSVTVRELDPGEYAVPGMPTSPGFELFPVTLDVDTLPAPPVGVPVLPRLTVAKKEGVLPAVELRWVPSPGHIYQLEQSDAGAEWEVIGYLDYGDNTTPVTIEQPITEAPAQMWRLRSQVSPPN